MRVFTQTSLLPAVTTTSYGGENITGFRVTKTIAAPSKIVPTNQSAALANANAWLLANGAKVDDHAKASTKRLIGRDVV